ncbi:MAG: MBL fold metallo-hydrolase [Deltaproteobacteria bacterium]|nr:MBL fold metallo-hydrolase [Deltaproteobacteria bacterium]
MSQYKNLLVFLIALFSITIQCSPAAGEGRSKEVAPGVYMIGDLSFSNCGYIVTDEGVVVVDTQLIPFFANEMIKEIKAITNKPIKYAINTHWHTDHVGGNEAFLPQTRIIAHEFTRKIIAKRRKEQEEGKVDENLKQLGEFKFTPPDITFDESMTLYMGNTVIELKFFGGGHSGGDIVVYLPKEKVLFSGDLFIKGSGLPDYRDDSNIDKLISSLRKMQSLDIEKIISGHMDIAEKKDIQTSIDKLISFRKQVEKYVDANIPPEKAAESIKFPEGENPFYEQNFKKVIHKVYNDIKNVKQSGDPT